ncbi:MAG: NADH-quinone oxidoreductase subunit NuoF [Bacillota bacterium]|jgi:NADH-quinone oxidoreductase F subunit
MSFYRAHVLVCAGTNCALKGSQAVRERLVSELEGRGLGAEVKVVETGCFGLCEEGPTVVVYPEGVLYCRVTPDDVPELVEEHLLKGRRLERLIYRQPAEKAVQTVPQMDFFRGQVRVVLRNCGVIDPESIEEYIAQGGYQALGKALTEMTPADVVAELKASGLRGRGGAGFPTGLKWEFAARAKGDVKYVVCNADEGEPGTFKDRLILEGDPHSVIEGMTIAAYAVGAKKGYVYIRGEYALSIERLETALKQARKMGLLGRDIFGSGLEFDIEVRVGAGAYVCGEETALFESLEGGRGEPRLKPPYPTDVGLFGKPTVINNVETLANVAPIISRGAKWYRTLGTEGSPGTKVFTLTGDIVNEGLIEVPMGITLREVIYGIGGGIPEGRGFKMAQTGGTSGGCLPAELLDVPMDYDELAKVGSALGSGALLIMDDTHCIVDIARVFSRFFEHESCGKCVPCREGTMRLHEIMTRITTGEATPKDIENLEALARTMAAACLCPLGQAAPVPVMTTFKYFREEYDAHIKEKRCPTGTCRALASPAVSLAAGKGV